MEAQSSVVQVATSSRRSHPVLRVGGSLGLALLALEIAHGIISVTTLPFGVSAIFFLIALIGLALAGIWSGRPGAGALAGLLAGALLGLGYAIGVAIGAIIFSSQLRASTQAALAPTGIAYSDQQLIGVLVVTVVISWLVSLGVGAACGAIGGWFASRRSKVASAAV